MDLDMTEITVFEDALVHFRSSTAELVIAVVPMYHCTMCKIRNFARKMGGCKFNQINVILASRDYL